MRYTYFYTLRLTSPPQKVHKNYFMAHNNLQQLHTLTNRALVILVSLVIIQLIAVLAAAPSHAATAPESCYSFSSGTITDYADLPTCPKDLDIPAAIGGAAVTTIGGDAFAHKGLTTLTIPNSVTSIGNSVFTFNQLTSVTIPDSVVSIGSFAFYGNALTFVIVEGTNVRQ